MNKRKRILTAVVAGILALLMIVPIIITIITSANAVSQEELDELQAQASALAERQQEILRIITSLEYEHAATNNKKLILDEKVDLTRQEIANLSAQISLLEEQILEKEVEYELACAEEEAQLLLFKQRLRAMEENGNISYFSIIFEAQNFSDLLSRLDFISEIMSYDEMIVSNLEAAKAATDSRRVELTTMKTKTESYRYQQYEKQAELQIQIDETLELMRQLTQNAEEFTLAYEDNQVLEERLLQDIDDMIQELEAIAAAEAAAAAAAAAAEAEAAAAAAAAEQNSNDDSYDDDSSYPSVYNISSNGYYIWPTYDSTYITSYFGTRFHPILEEYRSHNGIDIGASYGTDILAADSGVIVTAEYDYSYGNYVMIAHGDGRYTLYAHMSEILVSVGDDVYQGETIGLVGSTGFSTGPHIHFEVYEDGVRVDPLNYFD